MNTEPSKAREGLDLLPRQHPHFDVLAVDWLEPWEEETYLPSVWVMVVLGLRDESGEHWARYEYAVFKQTGAVHGVHMGAVTDDPLYELEDPDRTA